jgi:hypothetical protein
VRWALLANGVVVALAALLREGERREGERRA